MIPGLSSLLRQVRRDQLSTQHADFRLCWLVNEHDRFTGMFVAGNRVFLIRIAQVNAVAFFQFESILFRFSYRGPISLISLGQGVLGLHLNTKHTRIGTGFNGFQTKRLTKVHLHRHRHFVRR